MNIQKNHCHHIPNHFQMEALHHHTLHLIEAIIIIIKTIHIPHETIIIIIIISLPN